MKLILFNTCGAEASLALADTAQQTPAFAVATMPGRTASESLVAEVRKTMANALWRPSDIDAIVVVTGPGSFTGVRIGLSAAKGLSEATGKPLIAVSRLAMLAAAAQTHFTRVCALLDAGRGEFYCGQFDGGIEPRETLMSKEDALDAARLAETAVACEQPVFQAFSDSIGITLVSEPTAADALPLAMKRLALTKLDAGLFDDPMTLDATYLRRTDAEIFAKQAAPQP